MMIKNPQFLIHNSLFLLLLALLLSYPHTGLAQQPPTHTPDAEGNIYVVVQPNDSLWSIAANAGISMQALLDLNDLTEASIIIPGQLLLIGQAAPPETPLSPTPTPTPWITKPPPPPTATAVPPPRTAICLKAFSDVNRNGSHDPGEPFRGAVAFTVFNEQEVIGNYVSDGSSKPFCLEGLEPGEYQITRSVSQNETLTTEGNWTIVLAQGNVVELAFGSYSAGSDAPTNRAIVGESSIEITPTPAVETNANGRFSIIFIGAGLVVLFMLAGWFQLRFKKR
jgi:LysM repeat protein